MKRDRPLSVIEEEYKVAQSKFEELRNLSTVADRQQEDLKRQIEEHPEHVRRGLPDFLHYLLDKVYFTSFRYELGDETRVRINEHGFKDILRRYYVDVKDKFEGTCTEYEGCQLANNDYDAEAIAYAQNELGMDPVPDKLVGFLRSDMYNKSTPQEAWAMVLSTCKNDHVLAFASLLAFVHLEFRGSLDVTIKQWCNMFDYFKSKRT